MREGRVVKSNPVRHRHKHHENIQASFPPNVREFPDRCKVDAGIEMILGWPSDKHDVVFQ
jgi:hypothetical protein